MASPQFSEASQGPAHGSVERSPSETVHVERSSAQAGDTPTHTPTYYTPTRTPANTFPVLRPMVLTYAA